MWQFVKWSHDLPGFHGFSNYTGSPVTADYCFAAQNFKKKQCKDGVSYNSEIRAAIRSYSREADELFWKSLFLPMLSCLVDWIGDSVLDSCQSWCLLLNLCFASVIFLSTFLYDFFFFLHLLCSFKFWSLCCLFLLSGKLFIAFLESPPRAKM